MLLTLVLVAIFVVVVWNQVLFVKLRRFRADLKPSQHGGEGSSPFWQVNVTTPRNYTLEGRWLLRWYQLTQILILVLMVVLGGLWLRAG